MLGENTSMKMDRTRDRGWRSLSSENLGDMTFPKSEDFRKSSRSWGKWENTSIKM